MNSRAGTTLAPPPPPPRGGGGGIPLGYPIVLSPPGLCQAFLYDFFSIFLEKSVDRVRFFGYLFPDENAEHDQPTRRNHLRQLRSRSLALNRGSLLRHLWWSRRHFQGRSFRKGVRNQRNVSSLSRPSFLRTRRIISKNPLTTSTFSCSL